MTDTTQADQPSTKGTGKSAFITGGSKGIGYSTAEALLKAGYQVTITSRKQDEIQAAAQKLGEGARGEVCDVRDFAAVQSAIDAHVAAFGGLDAYLRQTGWLAEAAEANRPRAGGPPVRLPGARGLALRDRMREQGVSLHPGIIAGLRPWAERFAVAVPNDAATDE